MVIHIADTTYGTPRANNVIKILFVTMKETENSVNSTYTIESIAWNTPINIISPNNHKEYLRYVIFTVLFFDVKIISILLMTKNKTDATTNVVVRRKLSDFANPNHAVSE
jgi:hypothetical protein